MKVKLNRSLAALALLGVVAGGVAVTQVASAAPANMPIAGSVTLSGNAASTTITTVPNPALCPGNTAVGGYTWSGFIAPQTSDMATLAFTTTAVTGGFPMLPVTGAPYLNKPTDSDGNITGLDPFRIPNYGGTLTSGVYNVGVACVLAGQVAVIPNGAGTADDRAAVWATPITVTVTGSGASSTVSYTVGAPPVPPVLTTSSYNGTSTATVNFTHATSTPVTSGYAATITGSAVTGPVSISAGATSFQVTGFELGESISVSLVATNTSGTSAPSNVLAITAAVTDPAPIPVIVGNPFERSAFDIDWAAPASLNTPVSYTVEILTAPTTGAPVIVRTFPPVSSPTTILTVPAVPEGVGTPGLPAPAYPIGNYTARVTPVYAFGSGVTATPASQAFSVTPNTLVLQEITVTRPPGALVLTQRCGVYGGLPAFTAVDAFPGFPRALDAVGNLFQTTDFSGTAPDIDVNPAGDRTTGQYTPDPFFAPSDLDAPRYPEIGTYPSECGLSMATARLVTSGNLAGQFYTASGRLNQVTVLDTRDDDSGWTARGDIDDTFVGSTGNTFSGDYLGWRPFVTDTSDPVGGSTYDQVVTAGDPILPGTSNGLRGNPTLGQSQRDAGLGIATMDARMQLLIPASADAANYSATLSLTVVPRT